MEEYMKFRNAQIKHSADGSGSGVSPNTETSNVGENKASENEQDLTKNENVDFVTKEDFNKLLVEISSLKNSLSQGENKKDETKHIEKKTSNTESNYITKEQFDKAMFTMQIDKNISNALDKEDSNWREYPLGVIKTLVSVAKQGVKTEAPSGFGGKPNQQVVDVSAEMKRIVEKIKAEKKGGK
jgi:hypothetical protein